MKKYWSAEVTKTSIALDLEEGVFTWDSPKRAGKICLKKGNEP